MLGNRNSLGNRLQISFKEPLTESVFCPPKASDGICCLSQKPTPFNQKGDSRMNMEKNSSFTLRSNKDPILLNLKDVERTAAVCKALSSQTRLEILRCITSNSLTISQLADEFMLPMSSMCLHIKTLKDAGLIETYPKPGLHGTQKLCAVITSKISVDLNSHFNLEDETPPVFVEMPIGHYSSCEVTPPCGLAASDFYLAEEDSPYGFYSPERFKAGMLWFTHGGLEYQFSNASLHKDNLKQIEFSFEICSEAPGFNKDWPSDIDFELNHKLITTIHLKGDNGGRRGIYNPPWWSDNNSQYGEYVIIRITHHGCYFDQKKISDETIDSLGLKNGYHFAFTLKCNTSSAYTGGGMNLFGRQFGDYDQGIVMKVEYE